MPSFFVPGDPVTQGSVKAFGFKRRDGSIGSRVVSGAKNEATPLGGWRARIAYYASEAMRQYYEGSGPHASEVTLTLTFFLPRPKSAKPWKMPLSRRGGDIDKHARSVLDGLTGVVYEDDSQVTMLSAAKHYEGDPRGRIHGHSERGVYVQFELFDDEHIPCMPIRREKP